ncbi:hypothetical protein FKR81_12310 [Lentzea tibetensis]|uniref:Uncharacterized protein n=1 Tax=Lentzea tibetensis TaxID=2591470 RepID=A0A563EXA3_9PSEU|nr:hypothetical protein [Lentzea tibetensis]TWP52336.1 hypothetical protein FKR81_12310 [Lentzea tibetensis]
MGRATAAALLAVGVVLTAVAQVLPLYSSSYTGGVEVVVRAWGTTIINKPGDWPAGELSPTYGIPLTVTAVIAALAIAALAWRPEVARYAALGGALAQVGALGVLVALVMSERGHAVGQKGASFDFGIGLVLLVVATVVATAGAVGLQREAA